MTAIFIILALPLISVYHWLHSFHTLNVLWLSAICEFRSYIPSKQLFFRIDKPFFDCPDESKIHSVIFITSSNKISLYWLSKWRFIFFSFRFVSTKKFWWTVKKKTPNCLLLKILDSYGWWWAIELAFSQIHKFFVIFDGLIGFRTVSHVASVSKQWGQMEFNIPNDKVYY